MAAADRSTRPVFPLGSAVVPGVVVPLRIFEPRYRVLAERLASDQSDRLFSTVMIERGSEVGGSDVRSDIGCILEAIAIRRHSDGTWSLAAAATSRMRVLEWLGDDPYPRAVVEGWPDEAGSPVTSSELDHLLESLDQLAERAGRLGIEIRRPDTTGNSVPAALWRVATALPITDLDRHRVLGAPSTKQRMQLLTELAEEQLETLTLMSQQGEPPNG